MKKGMKTNHFYAIILCLLFNLLAVQVRSAVFNVKIKNISDDLVNNWISWTNISVLSQDWIISDQYLEVEYLTNHSIITGWGLQLNTHNKTNIADPMYLGTNNAAGLIDTMFSNRVINLAWLIKNTKLKPPKPTERGDHTGFTNYDWHYALDKSSTEFTNEMEYVVAWNQSGIAWHEAVRQEKPLKAYVYIAAKFQNLIISIFRTTQLRCEEYNNSEAKFLKNFFLYTNAWSGSNPVPNHYTPDYEDWNSDDFPAVTMDFEYTGTYHSPGTCVRIDYPSIGTRTGALVWFEAPKTCGGWYCSGPGKGYDLTGTSKLTFWVRANKTATAICEMGVNAGSHGPGDSCGTVPIDGGVGNQFTVTTTWTKHSITVTGKDMSHVSRGFKIGAWNPSGGLTLYVDDIRYEK
ncbi:MAG: hypothetical protein KKH98_03130 [Spirochaetes bacterium]|nr:hypothetical protein [Spirochaetota bacterium]